MRTFSHVPVQERVSSTPHSNPPGKARSLRARSLPSARPFRVAVFFSAIHYLGLIAAVTALLCVLAEPSQAATHVLVAAVIFSAIAWVIAFFMRRSTYCPLCKGTPLINSGARTHARARRIFPFSHGFSATLSILATQRFNCMYCGSDYDLLKPPSGRLHGSAEHPEPGNPAASRQPELSVPLGHGPRHLRDQIAPPAIARENHPADIPPGG